MPINTESLNKKLYDLLKTQGVNPIPKDSENQTTPVPDEAEVIQITIDVDGKPETAWATIDGNRKLVLYYDDSVVGNGDKTWENLRNVLKSWAMRKGRVGFELKNKNHLASDMAQRSHMKKKEQIAEGYHPMGKSASYNDNIPTVKIVLQHTRQIQEGEQRYRNIAKIFLENQQGERILCPSTKPGIAQIYARHLAEGGLPHDERWNHIGSLVEEYSSMAGFVRATRNGQFNESAQQLVQEGINHYNSLRETLGKMRGHRGYQNYFENYTPALMETEGDESINELFVQETLDPRIESVMPILAKLHKKVNEMSEVSELAEWADKLIEGDGGQEALNPIGIPESLQEDGTVRDVSDEEDFKARMKAVQQHQMTQRADPKRTLAKIRQQLIQKAKAKGIDTSKYELEEDLGPEQKAVGQLGPTEKVGSKGAVGKLVGACESVELEEGHMSNVDVIMQELGSGVRDIYDTMNNPKTPDEQYAARLLQDMYDSVASDTGLHPDDDFEQIIDIMGDRIAQDYPSDEVDEGRFTINAKTGAKLDPKTGAELPPKEKPVTMKQMFAKPKAPAAPKLTLDTVWRKVEDVVGQIYPDGDPIDWMIPWFRKQGIEAHKIGDIIDRAAKKNGYKDMYDYWNSFGEDTGYTAEGQVNEFQDVGNKYGWGDEDEQTNFERFVEHLNKLLTPLGYVQGLTDYRFENQHDKVMVTVEEDPENPNGADVVINKLVWRPLPMNSRYPGPIVNGKPSTLVPGPGGNKLISVNLDSDMSMSRAFKQVSDAIKAAASQSKGEVKEGSNKEMEKGHMKEGQEDLDALKRMLGEGIKGEIVGGTAGGLVGGLAGSALGPVGTAIGGALGSATGSAIGTRWEDEKPLKEREQLEEWAPFIAAGARLLLPVITRVGPALGRMFSAGRAAAATAGRATADVAGKAAVGTGKGALELGKTAVTQTAQNAGKVGLGVGAYQAITDIANSTVGGVGKVYDDIGAAVSDLSKIVGNAIDSATIRSLAAAAVKYAIPIGIIVALLYGGKKLIDKVMSESISETIEEGQEDLDAILRIVRK